MIELHQKWVATTRPALGSWYYSGPFAFQGNTFSPAPKIPVRGTIELTLQHAVGTVRLLRAKHRQANRTGSQVGQLQPFGVGLLVGDDQVKRQGASEIIATVANSPELEFEFHVLLRATCFADDIGQGVILPLRTKQAVDPLHAE